MSTTASTCLACDGPVDEPEQDCPQCGEPRPLVQKCGYCETPLDSAERPCRSCGRGAGEPEPAPHVTSDPAGEEPDDESDEALSLREYLTIVAKSGLIGASCFVVFFVLFWSLDSDARNSGVGFFLGLWRFLYPGFVLGAILAAIGNVPPQLRSKVERLVEHRLFKVASRLGLILFAIWLLGSC